jgi:dTDP-4-dehydrorhamnose 3,5-epimerase
MSLKLIDEQFKGIKVFEPKVYHDERGFFYESYKKSDFEEMGIDFVQDNHSLSQQGVIRGMHFQWDKPQGKLIRVCSGSAIFYEIDLRLNSEFFGRHFSIELNANNKLLLWVPAGFANGFLALSNNTEVHYKCTEYWNPKAEATLLWNDSSINIDWKIKKPIISEKDNNGITLENWIIRPESRIF